MRAERGDLLGGFFEPVVVQNAHFGVLKRNQVARVDHASQSVQSDNIARHVKARDLLAAVAAHHGAFQKTEANGVKRLKLVSGPVKRLAAADALSG